MAATIKPGRRVKLPNGKVGVVIHLGGQTSSAFVNPQGEAESYNVPLGQALIYEADGQGGFVLEKHPQFAKFRHKEIYLPIADLEVIL